MKRHRKTRRLKLKKQKTIMKVAVITLISSLAIGYASFQTIININVKGNIVTDKDCKIGNTWEYDYKNEVQEFEVPCDATYKVELWGAQGTGNGGKGGYSKGNIQLTKQNKLYIYVGSQTKTTEDYTIGGYNGGGYGSKYGEVSGYVNYSYAGGGATDIRTVNSNWDNFLSLKSRIMVAGGGAGEQQNQKYSTNTIPGYGGGLNGGDAGGEIYSSFPQPTGATQTEGGIGVQDDTFDYDGKFGKALQISSTNCWGSGGGGGYYGGAYGCGAAGSGGSSFISGHSGCDAIDENSTENNIIHTGQSIHYSKYKFTDTVMIDGAGCKWTNELTNECSGMPSHDGKSLMTGNTGNGYAKITLISHKTS